MQTIYSDDHRLQDGRAELVDGTLQACFESPRRADAIAASLRTAGLGEILPPDEFDESAMRRIHRDNFVEFLKVAWDLWTAAGRDFDALPLNWAVRGMRDIEPDTIDGKLSYFSFDAATPLTAGTWQAARSAVNVALTGAQCLAAGAVSAFSLCRPPGHHAAQDYYGGYCFLNNAAIAAQAMRDGGAERIAILDIDYHHGNGTQSIFYSRADVFFASIHGDPRQEFPYFLGYADETGSGAGQGCNANFPLPWDTAADDWFAALHAAIAGVRRYDPETLVVSLGVDTYVDDPISRFRLQRSDYLEVGRQIAALRRPTLFVMEGGYAVDAIGANVVNVLQGFADAR